MSATERFMTPSPSGITRRCQSLSANLRAVSTSSSWVTPTSTHKPAPMAPIDSSSADRTAARVTRCTTARTAAVSRGMSAGAGEVACDLRFSG